MATIERMTVSDAPIIGGATIQATVTVQVTRDVLSLPEPDMITAIGTEIGVTIARAFNDRMRGGK